MDSKEGNGGEKGYIDYSQVTESAFLLNRSQDECEPPAKKDKNFPVRLHYMLQDMERDGLQHIVSWQPHGRCFIVRDHKAFAECYLPLWFRQSKFASYQRQLNIYGFIRIASGPDKGGYYHELFLRGKQFLAQGIRRVEIKGAGHRKVRSSKNPPEFYKLPFLPPIKPAVVSPTAFQMSHSEPINERDFPAQYHFLASPKPFRPLSIRDEQDADNFRDRDQMNNNFYSPARRALSFSGYIPSGQTEGSPMHHHDHSEPSMHKIPAEGQPTPSNPSRCMNNMPFY